MSDETKPQDSAAMPPASDGSAVGEPDAWMHISGGLSLGVFKHVDPRLRHLCVPLYRHQPVAESATTPTLTDAEREAVEDAAIIVHQHDAVMEAPTPSARVVALRGLLERTK